MFEYLKGILADVQPTCAVVDCHGVGYAVNISLNTFEKISVSKGEVLLYVHLVVREDAQILYGFFSKEERLLFRKLISVSGIGPSTALLMLSSMSPGEIVGAVQTSNVDALKRIKGIGLKTAQRIIIELKDKLEQGGPAAGVTVPGSTNEAKSEAAAALIELGFVKSGVQKLMDRLAAEKPEATVEEYIKLALKQL